jgi:putative addiction module component (TIGR02574 family)
MSETLEKLKSQLGELTNAEKADLAHFLIHSLDEEDGDVEAAWDEELLRRTNEIKSGEAIGKPAEQVFSELRKKYS